MKTQSDHGRVSREGFARLDVSEGIPKILYILLEFEGCVQKELAGICQIKESTLTVMLKRMEGMGLIRKEATTRSGGKRAYGIYFTERGRKRAQAVKELVEDIDRKCLEGFTEEECEQFFSFMKRVQKNLSEYTFPEEQGISGPG